jgi:hypothetical protein
LKGENDEVCSDDRWDEHRKTKRLRKVRNNKAFGSNLVHLRVEAGLTGMGVVRVGLDASAIAFMFATVLSRPGG